MALYAKVQGGNTILEYQEFDTVNDQSQLAPNKPKWLPVVEVNAAYNAVTQVREGPVIAIAATQVTWTYTVRAKNADEVNQMRQRKLNEVHQEATIRLTPKAGAAGSQQLDALTRLVQLIYKYTDRTAWSQPDKNQVTASIQRIQDAASMRVAEDTKVTELQALVDPAAIDAYDSTANWPAS